MKTVRGKYNTYLPQCLFLLDSPVSISTCGNTFQLRPSYRILQNISNSSWGVSFLVSASRSRFQNIIDSLLVHCISPSTRPKTRKFGIRLSYKIMLKYFNYMFFLQLSSLAKIEVSTVFILAKNKIECMHISCSTKRLLVKILQALIKQFLA